MIYFLVILGFLIITDEIMFLYEELLKLENTIDFVILIMYSIIIISSIVVMYKIWTCSIKTNKKNNSVHVQGAFGRGKTYKVMNSCFDELLGEEIRDTSLIKNRIKNNNSLESEYISEKSRNDVLYFSALGKTQGELLSEINYETAYGINKVFITILRNFNLQKINSKLLFNDLEKNKSNKWIVNTLVDKFYANS